VVKRTDYGENAVSAARSVLIELAHLLGEYRDQFVIVGGWVPELLIDHPGELHVGSLDVDIALDHRNVPEQAYRTLQELLLAEVIHRENSLSSFIAACGMSSFK
jgi:tRNA nucleotidyltransferase/poly(A) polymerase